MAVQPTRTPCSLKHEKRFMLWNSFPLYFGHVESSLGHVMYCNGALRFFPPPFVGRDAVRYLNAASCIAVEKCHTGAPCTMTTP